MRHLENQKFGMLTAIKYLGKSKWLCRCDCGNMKEVQTGHLISGHTTSCGCRHKKPVTDLSGMKFGKLTPISYYRKDNRTYWHCKCDCGNEIDVQAQHLVDGHTKSCGCTKKNDLTGKEYGRLTVIKYVGKNKDNRNIWHCKCSCGNELDVLQHDLVCHRKTSCGCERYEELDKLLIGSKVNKLTVLYRNGKNKRGEVLYRCRCDCGNELDVKSYTLKNKAIKSCGHCNHVGEVINGCEVLKQVSKGRFIFKCPYCGKEFEAEYNMVSSGHKKSCGCQGVEQKDLTGKRFGKLVAIKRVENVNTRSAWLCKCDCGNDTIVLESNLQQGLTRSCGCLSVGKYGSLCENEIKDYIATLTDEKPQKVKILDGKEIDLYYEKYKIGIEYNGSVFHASIGNVYKDKDKYYHRDKFMCAKEHGIHLINIFDVDWETNKERIKTLLRYMFYDNTKLYARKCIVKEIDKYTAKMFCNKYHLKGFTPISTIYYGLYYKDELVSVMTFGRMRGKKESNTEFEMVRYCVKEDYNIIGGANKLLKAFEKEYNPKLVVSYSDNDYFTGDIYTKLGFENDGQCTINYYWYSDRVGEIKREACQVKKLKELYPELYKEAIGGVEDYIMSALGNRKVYRCGNTRWIKKY